jgi:hypothetical protein
MLEEVKQATRQPCDLAGKAAADESDVPAFVGEF